MPQITDGRSASEINSRRAVICKTAGRNDSPSQFAALIMSETSTESQSADLNQGYRALQAKCVKFNVGGEGI